MIEVHTYKYGGVPHYEFPVQLVSRTPKLWIVRGKYGRKFVHHTKGITFTIPNDSLEFYWTGRWYTIALDISGGLGQGYYCNINLPPLLQGDRVEWVDLDLDVLVTPDLQWRVVDEDEFAANSRRYGYPPEVVAGARRAVAEVVALVEGRQFPFDGKWAEMLA
ncbi:MAG TPA: DUF402 domain-containing protein [Symbiobacteriaceae bacterium]|nr:DUF402 domain-containing protein [Symbiobacteriaceae bacterium]